MHQFLSRRSAWQFFILLTLALIIKWLPFVHIPFKWLATYFHELSHGLAAILTGGQIQYIELYINGGGLCVTQGGSRFLISFAGYAGAALWGMLMVSLATLKAQYVKSIAVAFMLVCLLSLVLWIRDVLSLVVILVIMAVFALPLTQAFSKWIKPFFTLLGITTMLNAILSPLYLLDGRALGDGDNLAKLTHIPEFIWVMIWLSIGCFTLYRTWRSCYAK